jgi:hypothetical protein
MKTKKTQTKKFKEDELELIDYLKANFKDRKDLKLRSREAFEGLRKHFRPILDAALPPTPRKKANN